MKLVIEALFTVDSDDSLALSVLHDLKLEVLNFLSEHHYSA